MTSAFITFLVLSSATVPVPVFAGLLEKPVPLKYTCAIGDELIGGECYSKETRPMSSNCTSGFSKNGTICEKKETQLVTAECPAGYNWDAPEFPGKCSYLYDSGRIGHGGTGESATWIPCEADDPGEFKYGSGCYYVKEPVSVTCPADAPDAAPQYITKVCTKEVAAAGGCVWGTSQGIWTKDQRWSMNTSNYTCSRTTYDPLIHSCPADYKLVGGTCEKTNISEATVSCPTGHYRNGSQCMPGTTPNCGAGSTMRYGVCVASDGSLSCPAGEHLETSSNLCVRNYTDNDPNSFSSDDFNSYYSQGFQLGTHAAESVSMPSLAAGGKITMREEFLNNETKLDDGALFSDVNSGGVDANNTFESTDGTYQNEDNQSDFITKTLRTNEEFLDKSHTVSGATSEEIVDNTNHSALAYGTLMDTTNKNPPRKLSRDSAMFKKSTASFTDAFNGTGAFFGDCNDTTATYQEYDESKIITSEQTCFKPNKANKTGCVMDRVLIEPELTIIEGGDNASLSMCGEKCVRLTLGKVGNNYLKQVGACGIYREEITIALKKGNELVNANLVTGSYDDHFRLSADGDVFFDGVHMTFPTPDGFPTNAYGCEKSTSWTVPARDVTTSFVNAFDGDNKIKFDYRVGVAGEGEAYAMVDLHFRDPVSTHWQEIFKEYPEGCNAKLSEPTSYCSAGEWTCDIRWDWTPVNLGEWATEDTNGNWQVQASSSTVKQLTNGYATSYLSEKVFELNSFRGNIKVDTSDDDDFIGFVFGMPGKGADLTSSENSFFLVSWKQGSQSGAVPGIVLSQVFGDMNSINYAHQISTAKHKVLATNLGSGWRDNTEHEFQLDIRPNRFTLTVDGTERISKSGTFHKGRVGFYNNSQDKVIYSQVKQLYPESLGRDADYLFKPLFPGETNPDPVCMTGHREDYACDPLQGKKLSLNGGTFGFKDILNMTDACEPLDNDDQCDAISQVCVDGWEDEISGKCYAWDIKYECQDTSNAVVTKTRANNTCMTQTDCIGGDCEVRATEQNDDFIKALTTYATMNELGDTRQCDDPDDPETCRVFSGEARVCSWDQLKINDCCESPPGVGMVDVFSLARNTMTVTKYMASADGVFGGTAVQEGLTSAGEGAINQWQHAKGWVVDNAAKSWQTITQSNFGQAVQGQWSKLANSEAVGNVISTSKEVWGNLTNVFTSQTDNLTGNATAAIADASGQAAATLQEGTISSALSTMKDKMMQKVYDLLPDALQSAVDSAASSLATSASGTATQQTGAAAMNTLASNIMMVVNFVGYMYAVYQLAKLAYTMLTACDESEQDMGTLLLSKKCFKTSHKSCKKVFGVCTNKYKDFHCCYDSVISRIIMEQAITQLGWSTKTYRDSMGCRGLKISELTQIDFSRIDFTEWIDLMAQSDMLPKGKDMDSVTGGNISNNYGRDNTLERMENRGGNTGLYEKARTDAEKVDTLNTVNCNERPRPKSCEMVNYTNSW